jgi:hypothetical protein
MNFIKRAFLQVTFLAGFISSSFCAPTSGFYLPDSITQMTLKYRLVRQLIVLPFVINDSIRVNLILDTGCRNLVLFGKQFQKMLQLRTDRQVQFSGLGSGAPVYGNLSLDNKVSLQEVLGEQIPIVVVPDRNVLSTFKDVHGIIGHEIFLKFEIELNPALQTITFRPATTATAPEGFKQVPLKLIDSRPIVESEILLSSRDKKKCQLMIDTGSVLGLLVKTTNISDYENYDSTILGYGLNGPIMGFKIFSTVVRLATFDFAKLQTGVIESPWHNYASIGMQVLKDYVVVLNYCKAYACFKEVERSTKR